MDNLKAINDTYGHAEVDKTLIILANALESSMEDGDMRMYENKREHKNRK